MKNIPTYIAKIPIRWRDMDAFGHVNNSVYFTYFEQARAMWWQEVGVPLRNSTEGPVVITASCTFLKPLHYPGNLEAHLFAHSSGTTSFVIDYILHLDQQLDQKIAEGSTKVVWVDYSKSKSIPLPEIILKHIKHQL